MNQTLNFYKDLPVFSGTENIVNTENYFLLPTDWSVVVTDIQGSTKAIEEGRYKDVNVVGVGTIISTQNACGQVEIPFIFGGDGATLFVPNEQVPVVKDSLAFSRDTAKKVFNLDLRVAIIPMTVIVEKNKTISIAKMNLSGQSCIAMAKGDGLALAEELTKNTESYLVQDTSNVAGSHQGLECRWNPVRSQRGNMVALIIKVEDQDLEPALVYKDIVLELKKIVPDFQLITPSKLSTAWPPVHLYKEVKMKYKGLMRAAVYVGLIIVMFILTLVVKLTKKNLQSAVSKYLNELSSNTDFVKFDEVLRMVIDVDSKQSDQINKYLCDLESKNKIKFGMHSSSEALMTCYIQSQTNHIHFIDGGSGGYAMAAKKMKAKK